MEIGDLTSVQGIASENDEITVPMVRWWIFRGQEIDFEKCIVRIGRRTFLDRKAVSRWLEERRETSAPVARRFQK